MIGIDAFMFVFETGAGIAADSMALRADAIGKLAVILAAGAVYLTQSAWPDLRVAFAMAALCLHSAYLTIRQAQAELRQPPQADCARTG